MPQPNPLDLQRLYELSPDALIVSSADGVLLSVNPAFANSLGYAEDELIDQPMLEQLVHADDLEATRRELSTLAQGAASLPFEIRCLTKDGVARWFQWSARIDQESARIYAIGRDVTEQRAALEQLEQSAGELRMLATAVEAAAPAIFTTGPDGRIEWANKAFEELTGWTIEDARGQTPRILKSGRQSDGFYGELWKKITRGQQFRSYVTNRRRDGQLYTADQTITPVLDGQGAVVRYIAVQIDVTKELQSEHRIERLLHYDELTGLPNRNLVRERVAEAIESARRTERVVAVLLLDLDRFKDINDSLGHVAGDALLAAIASRLTSALRPAESVGRLGGDEFLFIAQRLTSEFEAAELATRLLATLEQPVSAGEHELVVTASVGIAVYPRDGTEDADLIQLAEAAMYSAKEAMRGGYQFSTPELNRASIRRMELLNGLRGADAWDGFMLHYQPVVAIATGEVVAVEALARWMHPVEGVVSPEEFVPLAEEAGLIDRLGDWALSEALGQLQRWRRRGRRLNMAVNVAPQQLRDPGFIERLISLLHEHEIEPEGLELEITERSVVDDADEVMQTLAKLRELRVGISIDDFGVGYSALNYLRRLPITKVKLDRSFVQDVMRAPREQVVARGIITMAHLLGLTVVAEGIETAAELGSLTEFGCDEYQGFLHSRPAPADEIDQYLTGGLHAA